MLARRGPYHSSKATRTRLRDALVRQPRSSPTALSRELGLSWGAVAHHLKAMEARGEVRVERDGRSTRYALVEPTPETAI